jgi:hypothetical protein
MRRRAGELGIVRLPARGIPSQGSTTKGRTETDIDAKREEERQERERRIERLI